MSVVEGKLFVKKRKLEIEDIIADDGLQHIFRPIFKPDEFSWLCFYSNENNGWGMPTKKDISWNQQTLVGGGGEFEIGFVLGF